MDILSYFEWRSSHEHSWFTHQPCEPTSIYLLPSEWKWSGHHGFPAPGITSSMPEKKPNAAYFRTALFSVPQHFSHLLLPSRAPCWSSSSCPPMLHAGPPRTFIPHCISAAFCSAECSPTAMRYRSCLFVSPSPKRHLLWLESIWRWISKKLQIQKKGLAAMPLKGIGFFLFTRILKYACCTNFYFLLFLTAKIEMFGVSRPMQGSDVKVG